jgi:hypothetical protein
MRRTSLPGQMQRLDATLSNAVLCGLVSKKVYYEKPLRVTSRIASPCKLTRTSRVSEMSRNVYFNGPCTASWSTSMVPEVHGASGVVLEMRII